MKSNTRGFTLIELMVVMSIIGMLASVVLVSLQSARDKGRMASSIIFSTSMYRGWGADSFGAWDFDEGGNQNANDSGPNNITLISNGLSPRSSNKPLSSGFSLDYSGSNYSTDVTNYFRSGDLYSRNIDLAKGGGYTVSLWIYSPNASTQGRPVMVFGSATNSNFDILANININPSSGGQVHVGPRLSPSPLPFSYAFPVEKWTHLAYSYERSTGKLRLYIDGKLFGTKDITAAPSDYRVKKVVVGVNYNSSDAPASGSHFNGLMDELAIYNNVLTADIIDQIYAEGAKRHNLAISK